MDNFKWTDELVKEFTKAAIELQNKVPQDVSLERGLYHFKKEKSKKPEWEILSLFHLWGEVKTFFNLKEDGFFHCEKYSEDNFVLDDFLKNKLGKTYYIHSVKRISDGQILSIDDKTDMGEIYKFQIAGKEMIAHFNNNYGFSNINFITKIYSNPLPNKEPEPIKVISIINICADADNVKYELKLSKMIPPNTGGKVATAIESILNEQDCLFNADNINKRIAELKGIWTQTGKPLGMEIDISVLDNIDTGVLPTDLMGLIQKLKTDAVKECKIDLAVMARQIEKLVPNEILTAQHTSFYAARETDSSLGSWLGHLQTKEGATLVYKTKYPTFADYIQDKGK